jgi:mono/diheme cytochrome c family protein
VNSGRRSTEAPAAASLTPSRVTTTPRSPYDRFAGADPRPRGSVPRARPAPSTLLVLALIALLPACAPPAPVPAAATPAVSAQVATPQPGAPLYTMAQAQHGERVFNTVCSVCHGAAEFRGRMFEITWMTQPVGDLFQHISAAMPQDRPGSLSPEEYAAVVAYLLQMNGRPAGDTLLPADPRVLEGYRW